MEAGIDKVVCWSQMILTIIAVDEREVLQVSIIVEDEIVEDDHAKKLQYLNRSRPHIFADDIGTFLITQIAILVVTPAIDLGSWRRA